MVNEAHEPRAETPQDLRVFGAILSVVLAGLAWRLRIESVPGLRLALAVACAILALASAFAPRALRFIYRPWMRLARVLGAINTTLLLTLSFVLVVAPIGLLLRLFGWDPLGARKRKASTYWIARDPSADAPERMRRLY